MLSEARSCRVDECGRAPLPGRRICNTHRLRWRIYRSYDLPSRRTPAADIVTRIDGSVEFPIYRSGAVIAYTQLDASDVPWASRWRWNLFRGYATRQTRSHDYIFMHRELLNAPPFKAGGLQGDHRNHDRLDNRRENLRLVPGTGNAQNTTARAHSSKYRGVTFDKKRSLWVAQAKMGGHHFYLGGYADEQEAAEVAAKWRLINMPGATD